MKHKIKMRTNKEVMAEWGKIRYHDYPVPDFGVDSDVITT
jgi:hypothetical protein